MTHRMRTTALALAAGLLSAACGAEPDPSTSGRGGAPALDLTVPVLAEDVPDMHALVPSDAVGFVQVVSIGTLRDAFDAYASLLDPGASRSDPRPLLHAFGISDPDSVALDRPCGVAFTAGSSSLDPTIILPATDVDALRASAAPGVAVEARGDYVAFSPAGAPAARGSALTMGLRSGTVAGRLDVPPVVDALRVPIEGALALMQMQAAAQPAPAGVDMAAMFTAYTDMARGLLDAIETVEFTVGQDGGSIEVRSELTVEEGSGLGGFPPPRDGDLRGLASRVDPDGPTLVLARADIDTLMGRYEHLLRAYAEAFLVGEDANLDVDEYVGTWQALYRLGGGAFAGTFSMGGGMDFLYMFDAANPDALVSTATQLLEDGFMDTAVASLELEGESTVEGVPVVSFRQTMDMDAFLGDADPQQREETRRILEAMYGGALETTMHVYRADGRVAWSLRSRDEGPDLELARAIAGPGHPLSEEVAGWVTDLESHDAGVLMRMDVVHFARESARTVGATDPSVADMLRALEGGSAELVLEAVVSDHTWTVSGSFDLAGLMRAFLAGR